MTTLADSDDGGARPRRRKPAALGRLPVASAQPSRSGWSAGHRGGAGDLGCVVALARAACSRRTTRWRRTCRRLRGAGRAHWFGTDQLGRDMLSRVIYGARLSIPLALLSSRCRWWSAGCSGSVAGYFGRLGRRDDHAADRPGVRLPDRSSWPWRSPRRFGPSLAQRRAGPGHRRPGRSYARVIRSAVLGVRERRLRQRGPAARRRAAARRCAATCCRTASARRWCSPPWSSGNAMLLLAAPVVPRPRRQAAVPEWGAMVALGRAGLFDAGGSASFPGLAILTVVLAFNFLGDALRDRARPPHRRGAEVAAAARRRLTVGGHACPRPRGPRRSCTTSTLTVDAGRDASASPARAARARP